MSTVIGRVLARRGGLAGLSDPKPYLVRAIQNEARNRYRPAVRRATVPIGIGAQPTVELENDDCWTFWFLPHPKPRVWIQAKSSYARRR